MHKDISLSLQLFLQHNIKKIRNNVQKSNKSVKPRCLTTTVNGDKKILWSQLFAAYNFDQSQTSIHIHERLTEQHFHLDAASKMRNHLAEDVLDKKMLYLVKVSINVYISYKVSMDWSTRDHKVDKGSTNSHIKRAGMI